MSVMLDPTVAGPEVMLSPGSIAPRVGRSPDVILARIREGELVPDIVLELGGDRSYFGFRETRLPEIVTLLHRPQETAV